MKNAFMEKRRLTVAICFLLITLFPVQVATACSWDYSIWAVRRKTADPLYRFIQNSKAGYIDRSGKVVIKPRFDFMGNHGGEFHDGLLDISFDDAGYADQTGKVVIGKKYYWSEDFSEGLAVVKDADTDRWGYIDRTGEIVLVPHFGTEREIYPSSFSDGLAAVKAGAKYGYIDRSGKFVIEPKFVLGRDFADGMGRVVVEGPCVYYDRGPCGGGVTYGQGIQGTASACKFTFIDKSGSTIAGGFEDAKDFSEGLAAVVKDGKWGYIDKKGRMVIEPKFEEAEPFADGLARIKQGELWGYIDHTGELAIGLQFEYAQDFSDGLAVVGKWNDDEESELSEFYYIDRRGVQAIAEKFVLASHFFKGLAHVKLKSNKKKSGDDSDEGETFAYINTTGKKVFTYFNKHED